MSWFDAAGGAGPWVAVSLAVALGVVTQRATGGAFGMIVAPLVALIAPERMPAGILLISLGVLVLSTPRHLGDIGWRELIPAVSGRAVGAIAAAGVVSLAPDPGAVAMLVAAAVLVGVALSLSGLRLAVNAANLFGAGALSGLTGTLTSVGAPPMTLLYQHAPAAHVRATLNTFFTVGVFTSLAALALHDQIAAADAWFAVSMAPAIAVGLAASGPAMRWLAGRSLRPLILALASLASVLILVRGLAG